MATGKLPATPLAFQVTNCNSDMNGESNSQKQHQLKWFHANINQTSPNSLALRKSRHQPLKPPATHYSTMSRRVGIVSMGIHKTCQSGYSVDVGDFLVAEGVKVHVCDVREFFDREPLNHKRGKNWDDEGRKHKRPPVYNGCRDALASEELLKSQASEKLWRALDECPRVSNNQSLVVSNSVQQ